MSEAAVVSEVTEEVALVRAEVLPVGEAKLGALRAKVNELVRDAGVEVVDAASRARAVDAGVAAKTFRTKVVEDVKARIVREMLTVVDAVRQRFLDLASPLSDVEADLKKKIAAYDAKVAAEAAAARAKAEAEQRARDEEARKLSSLGVPAETILDVLQPAPPPPPPPPSTKARTESGAYLGGRKTWNAEVLDVALVPAEYHTIDLVKVKRDREKRGGVCPGIRYFQVESSDFSTSRGS